MTLASAPAAKAACVSALALICGPAAAQLSATVDLELVLAVDVSFSMGPEEQALQRRGYVGAFRSPEVWAAIRNGPLGRIAVTYVEWGGKPVQVVPWTAIDGPAAAEAFAAELHALPLQRLSFTSITEALLFSARLFRTNAFAGARRVIDVSGDGPNNSGAPVPLARNTLVGDGIVIDGLPIMLERPARPDSFPFPGLDAYYRNCVIGGPGAFAVKVTDPDEFAGTIRQKLIFEISGQKTTRLRDQVHLIRDEPVNCMIGEELHESGSQ